MKLFNTLTKQTEEIKPLDGSTVRIYSCGPTVYDHAHIGNLSSFIYADVLRRVVGASGLDVRHVMNFTDVDDKTIKRSREENPQADPMQALSDLTGRYTDIFLEDMKAIGNDVDASEFKKATEHIGQMQDLIRRLLNVGIAYIADDGVYFSIDAYKQKGKKYGQLLNLTNASTAEARIQNDEYDKESVHDFALWKKHKENEPSWELELNGQRLDGRPGWHIECSAMSEAALGLPFDIHTGGIDLIFPHHENEIAQSTAVSDQYLMAKVFFHNEHVLVDGKKMSKSLGNFHTLEDIRDRGFDPLAFRLLVLQSHYRSRSNFSWEILEAAQNRLKNWRTVAAYVWQPQDIKSLDRQEYKAQLLESLQDDLNTPRLVAQLDAVFNEIETSGISSDDVQPLRELLDFINETLGIDLWTDDITDEQKRLIGEREQARSGQDWAKSDELRDILAEQGIGVKDTPQGTVWNRL